jgi:hypothetical protein
MLCKCRKNCRHTKCRCTVHGGLRYYGLYCGPSWTAGKKKDARDILLNDPELFDNVKPKDGLDAACRIHDMECGSDARGCSRKADNKLVASASKRLVSKDAGFKERAAALGLVPVMKAASVTRGHGASEPELILKKIAETKGGIIGAAETIWNDEKANGGRCACRKTCKHRNCKCDIHGGGVAEKVMNWITKKLQEKAKSWQVKSEWKRNNPKLTDKQLEEKWKQNKNYYGFGYKGGVGQEPNEPGATEFLRARLPHFMEMGIEARLPALRALIRQPDISPDIIMNVVVYLDAQERRRRMGENYGIEPKSKPKPKGSGK